KMSLTGKLAAFLVVSFALVVAGDAQAQKTKTRTQAARAAVPNENALRERINEWTVGLAGGLLEGAPIRLATEISRVVNDGENLHVLPIVTRGPTENVNDILYLKGVDMAIISSDSLEEYKTQVPDIQRRLTYILNLFPSELHVFVRPEIRSLRDLAGKKVNFNTVGTAAAFSGPSATTRNLRTTIFPPPSTRWTIQTSSQMANGSKLSPSLPFSPPTTGATTRTGIGAWRVLSTISSAASTSCRRPASTPSGRT